MPMTCARCGAANPDGNAFCQSCGTPLGPGAMPVQTAQAPPGPPQGYPQGPAAYAPPPPPPYQSPYYRPAPGYMQPPVHRTPWMLILSAIVALVLVMVGAGTAIAILGAHSTSAGTAGINDQLPTPSPAGTPTPIGSPTPLQTGSGASTDTVSMPVPAGWSVANKDNESITLASPSGDGSVTAASGASQSATAQANKSEIDKYFTGKYPDTRNCPGTGTTTGTLSGARGIFWSLCFTLTSAGLSFPAAASLFAGANSDGSVFYLVMVVTSQDNMPAFIAESRPVLQGIQWKLK